MRVCISRRVFILLLLLILIIGTNGIIYNNEKLYCKLSFYYYNESGMSNEFIIKSYDKNECKSLINLSDSFMFYCDNLLCYISKI